MDLNLMDRNSSWFWQANNGLFICRVSSVSVVRIPLKNINLKIVKTQGMYT